MPRPRGMWGDDTSASRLARRWVVSRPHMAYDFDLLVIGSGPAGQKAAIQAAKLHRRVAIVEQQRMVGGVCINSGTIPSKTLREAVLFLTGMTQRSMYGDSYRVLAEVTMGDLFFRTQ